MKNILLISTTSQIGGGPKHLYSLIKYLDRSKYNIIVAAPNDGEYFERFKEEANTLELKNITNIASNYRILAKAIDEYEIDIVHSHGRGAGIYSRLLKKNGKKINVVHTFHGIHYENVGKFSRMLRMLSDRVLKQYTDAFVCVSRKEKADAITNGFAKEQNTFVVYNGIDPDIFNMDFDRSEYRNQLGLKDTDLVLGYVARLCETKGHKVLIRAFADFSKQHKNSKLLLVGEGETKEELKRLAQGLGIGSRVIFLGNRNDVPSLLKCMDMYVSASYKEGLPYTLIEALAAGTLAIATDVTGNSEVITNGENGLLCKPFDYAAMLDAIKEMHSYKKAIKDYFINSGKKTVNEKFLENKMVKSNQEIYDKLS